MECVKSFQKKRGKIEGKIGGKWYWMNWFELEWDKNESENQNYMSAKVVCLNWTSDISIQCFYYFP